MKLDAYLRDQDIPIAIFARRLGVSVQTVYRYLTGERLPAPAVMVRIAELTWHKVQPNDWFGPAKRRRRKAGRGGVQDEARPEEPREAR